MKTGDPDFSTQVEIIKAAHEALQKRMTHYSFSQGQPELRTKISDVLNKELRVAINNEWILFSSSAAQGIYSVMSALQEKDDEVIVLEANWPTMDSLAVLLGANVKNVYMLQ